MFFTFIKQDFHSIKNHILNQKLKAGINAIDKGTLSLAFSEYFISKSFKLPHQKIPVS